MHRLDKSPQIVEHELFPKKFWSRLMSRRNRNLGRVLLEAQPVLVGWLVREQPVHYLVTKTEYGIYEGIVVHRGNRRLGRFAGQHQNKVGLDALVTQGMRLDKTCGMSDYTVGECFDRFHWNKGMLDEQSERQDSER
jgi:hypothetical protein